MSGIDISDKDAWDDSRLIKTWDSLLGEYKKYHSLEAEEDQLNHKKAKLIVEDSEKEDDVGDLESDVEIGIVPEDVEDDIPAAAPESTPIHFLDNNVPDTAKPTENQPPTKTPIALQKIEPTATEVSTTEPNTFPSPFDGLDPSIRELVMSWYWAGYYQGLYKGKTEK